MPATVDMAPTERWIKEQQAVSAITVEMGRRDSELAANAGMSNFEERQLLFNVSSYFDNVGPFARTVEGIASHLKRDAISTGELIEQWRAKGVVTHDEKTQGLALTATGHKVVESFAATHVNFWP